MSHFPFDASRTINGIITVVPPASAAGAIIVSGSNTVGGSSYVDFIKITNTSAGALTPSKTLRLDNSGSLQLINNAYNQNLFSITDAGNTLIYGGSSATTADNDATAGSLRFGNNNSQIYDDVFTLCNTHHKKLHAVYGKAPELTTAKKQSVWINKQKDKHNGNITKESMGPSSSETKSSTSSNIKRSWLEYRV